MRPGLGYDELRALRKAYRKLIRSYAREAPTYPHLAMKTWEHAEQVRAVIEQIEVEGAQ